VTLPSIPTRFRRLAVGTVVVIGLGVTLSACGNSGTTLAQQACGHSDRSLTLLARSTHETDAVTANTFKEQAYQQLRQALPIAAEAAYHDGQWQALMTTVSESNRVPESTLVDSLRVQCQQADSTTFGQPSPPSSIPPPAPVSTSP
jgi:Tfp pilus assembly protein PilN